MQVTQMKEKEGKRRVRGGRAAGKEKGERREKEGMEGKEGQGEGVHE